MIEKIEFSVEGQKNTICIIEKNIYCIWKRKEKNMLEFIELKLGY